MKQREIGRRRSNTKEEYIAKCIEKWQEAIMELTRVAPDYKELPDSYQIAALRGMLTGKYKDHIDMQLADQEYDKAELLNKVRRYATIKRREVTNSSAMEVDAVNKGKGSGYFFNHRWPWIQECFRETEKLEWEQEEANLENRGAGTSRGSGTGERKGQAVHWELLQLWQMGALCQ